jgi:release factor glutamine methyltransferase
MSPPGRPKGEYRRAQPEGTPVAAGAVTVAQALAAAIASGVPRLDAHLLLGECLGRSRAWLLAHDDAELTPVQRAGFEAWAARRAAGEPFAYIVGHKEFHGLDLRVGPAVLVPRPDTETLVDWAIELLTGPLAGIEAPQVLDLGTGSGAIALAVQQAVPRARVTGLDASAEALAVAADNGRRLGLPVTWLLSDWWQAVPSAPLHLALSNPPYGAEGDPHLLDLRHEPVQALVAPGNGLDDLQQVIDGARQRLAPAGWLRLEHGHDQGAEERKRLAAAGFESVATRRDLGPLERCSGGRQPG